MPGIDAAAPAGWGARECEADGWVAGASVALGAGVGVPARAGESADRMPGIDGWVPAAPEPGACPVGECAAGPWLAPLGAAA
jgi:hypothetical protein